MIKIAICDDEEYYRGKIQKLLVSYLTGKHLEHDIRMFLSGEDFLAEQANLVKYDIVFMDINMNEVDGIETAKRIRSFHSDTYIVFVTAFISYVLEGYKVNAVRYIMKDTLETSVEECMDAVLRKMKLQKVSFEFIEGERTLYTDNLLYVESSKHKAVFYYLESGLVQYQIYDKLDNIEAKLSPYGFLRIHKSYLVNMRHIQKISNYQVILDTGECLSVPRLRFQNVKEAYVAYRGVL